MRYVTFERKVANTKKTFQFHISRYNDAIMRNDVKTVRYKVIILRYSTSHIEKKNCKKKLQIWKKVATVILGDIML